MIHASITHLPRYTTLHPLFPQVLDFIQQTDLHALPVGIHPILGEDLFVIVEKVAGRSREAAKLECHRRYIDIQLVLSGVDEMGWRALAECHQPIAEFNTARDIQFFDDTPSAWIATPPDTFCLFFPDDAHAPLVSTGDIHKLIFKIAVNPTTD
ncbi:MAG: YhcH/YjgK/YiaL family protein [Gallionella sp.]|nr:YhcH/YjgK/YiaL family protein [Gallionella sp.]MDD4960011.1 YhcH/YjgK/YiaL family protein [Gallionella sp.]